MSTWGALFLPHTHQQTMPLYQWLYQSIQQAILKGQLKAGERVPASRTLAEQLGVSRNTVRHALDLLLAEGYLEARQGSGTFIAAVLADANLQGYKKNTQKSLYPVQKPLSALAQRMQAVQTMTKPIQAQLLAPAVPDLRAFPYKLWQRCLTQDLSGSKQPDLRVHIAEYLALSRGVKCVPEQVFIYEGSGRILHLLLSLLANPHDPVLIEEPCWTGIAGMIQTLELDWINTPADEQGFNLEAGLAKVPKARLALLTPSRNYPFGYTLSLERRLQLLAWASEQGAWIIEDDYDSEFRFRDAPITALQGLDYSDSVFYTGTFSRVMFPSIRLGYVVAPSSMVEVMQRAQRIWQDGVSSVLQAGMAQFMAEGHFSRHIQRMRKLYRERHHYFVDLVEHELSDYLKPLPSDGGMHLVYGLADKIKDADFIQQTQQHGLGLQALSRYFHGSHSQNGLVMGFAAHTEGELRYAMKQLKPLLEQAYKKDKQ